MLEIDAPGLFNARLPVFAKLKVREFWTFDGRELKFWQLNGNSVYCLVQQSLAFPFLDPQNLIPFLEMLGEIDENTILHKLIDWVHSHQS